MNYYAIVDTDTSKIRYTYASTSNLSGKEFSKIKRKVHNGYNEDRTIRWREIQERHPLMYFTTSNYIHIEMDRNFKDIDENSLIYSSNEIKLIDTN
jgi:hypothetical protein